MSVKITEKLAAEWLKQNAPHIKLIKWGGSASTRSLFLDKKREREFYNQFKLLKSGIRRNPNVEFGLTNKEKLEKLKNSVKENYGVNHPMYSKKVKNRMKNTFLEKYGVDSNLKFKDFYKNTREKVNKTNIEKYGGKSPLVNEELKKKARETKIKNGHAMDLSGLTTKEFAKQKGISEVHLQRLHRNHGLNFIKNYKKKQTELENIVSQILNDLNISYKSQVKIKNYVADFLLIDHNIIIECDGFLTHSDATLINESFSWTSYPAKDKFYHKYKLKCYESLGYRALFFREDELKTKLPIVKSIILNLISQSKRIFARETNFTKEKNDNFFKNNHLMGKGSGRIYVLKYDDKIVAAMQVRWKNKKEKILEISRFCSKLNYSIVGGFSKLLKNIIKKESPKKVISFVDRRYGNGNSLLKNDFVFIGDNISFEWTNLKESIHRMKFPSSSGYENGWYKIWDCGQSKYELII